MSGALATFSTGLNALSAIASLAFGALGGVVLGDFVFSGFEVPASVKFGGAQAMTVHKLVGGERVVDLLGPDDATIDWSGTFMDGGPASRAQQLDQMRSAGQPLPLTWGTFYYTVLIANFEADTRYQQVPYRISCLVLRNEAAAEAAFGLDLQSAATDDIGAAVLSAPAALAPVMATAQSLVTAAAPLLGGGSAAIGLASAVGQAQGALGGLQATSEGAMALVASNAPVGGLVGSAGDLTGAVTNSGLLAQLRQTAGYLGRVGSNLGLPAFP